MSTWTGLELKGVNLENDTLVILNQKSVPEEIIFVQGQPPQAVMT